MKQNEKYRYAEHCLYSYRKNQETYRTIKLELQRLRSGSDVHGQNYGKRTQTGSISPVERYVERIEKLEYHLRRIKQELKPVLKVILETRHKTPWNIMRVILESYYLDHGHSEHIRARYRLTRKAYYEERRRLVRRVIFHMETSRTQKKSARSSRPWSNNVR